MAGLLRRTKWIVSHQLSSSPMDNELNLRSGNDREMCDVERCVIPATGRNRKNYDINVMKAIKILLHTAHTQQSRREKQPCVALETRLNHDKMNAANRIILTWAHISVFEMLFCVRIIFIVASVYPPSSSLPTKWIWTHLSSFMCGFVCVHDESRRLKVITPLIWSEI